MNAEKKVRKLVIKNLHNFWLYVVFSFIFALVIQIIGLIPPIFMQRVIDIYIPNKDLNNTIVSVIFFITIPLITTLFTTIYNYSLNVVGRKMGQFLTTLGFEKIVYQPAPYFDEQNSAEIADYCKSEAMNYIVFWIFDIPQLLASILSGLVIYIFIVNINIYIALILLIYIPLSILPSKYLAGKIDKFVKKIVDNNAKSSQLINDTFRGIKFVKAMLLEKIQIDKMKKINEDTIKIWSKTVAIDNLNGSWTNGFIDNLFTGIIFSLSAIFIINGSMSLGLLVLLLNYSPRVFNVIKSISNTNFNFKKQIALYDKFFNLIVMEDERQTSKESKKFVFDKSIELKNIEFAYTSERGYVLKGLDITIEKNKWIGIVGKSGAGKTTIFELLLKFYTDYDGKILIDNIDAKNIDPYDIRKNITRVSQDMFLFPGSIRDNLIIIKPNATDAEILEVIKKVGLADFINKLPQGMETELGEDGTQLSGGEKQRLCLAQGLLRESKILLLDEVTANVDISSEETIKNTITSLMKSTDLTVVSISHRLSFLENADTIYILENGKVVGSGDYNYLIDSCFFDNEEEED